MENTIAFRVTVEYDCPDMVDEASFYREYEGNAMAVYREISDNFRESPWNYTEVERVVKVEVIKI